MNKPLSKIKVNAVNAIISAAREMIAYEGDAHEVRDCFFDARKALLDAYTYSVEAEHADNFQLRVDLGLMAGQELDQAKMRIDRARTIAERIAMHSQVSALIIGQCDYITALIDILDKN